MTRRARTARRAAISAAARASTCAAAHGAHQRERAVRSLVNAGGDWPRTTRVMPWMIAGFLVILWLVPFNVIQLRRRCRSI